MNNEASKIIGIQVEPLSQMGGTDAKAIIGGLSYPVICMCTVIHLTALTILNAMYHDHWTSVKATCFPSGTVNKAGTLYVFLWHLLATFQLLMRYQLVATIHGRLWWQCGVQIG